MCSLSEAALDPELVRKPSKLERPVCKKCDSDRCVVNLRVSDTYCRDCFLTGVEHKFRSTLGKHKAMRPKEKVLVAYSGGVNSTALLHLLKEGINADHKKLLFFPTVVHIDEGCSIGLDTADRQGNARAVAGIADSYGFPTYALLLEDVMDGGAEPRPSKELDSLSWDTEERRARTSRLLAVLKDNSGRQDVLRTLKRRLLVRAARSLGCAKVFCADNGDSIAIDLMAGVACGQGAGLPHTTGFRDTRDKDVTILRPMRDVSSKEVGVYCRLHNLETFVSPVLGTAEETLYSIRKLTENFLTELHADFPATLSTIFRTGDKLKVEQDSSDRCLLCRGPADTESSGLSALQATRWSQFVSREGQNLPEELLLTDSLANVDLTRMTTVVGEPHGPRDKTKKDDGCCGEGDGSCSSQLPTAVGRAELEQGSCYSCRLACRHLPDTADLPPDLLADLAVLKRRKEAESQIKDFLL